MKHWTKILSESANVKEIVGRKDKIIRNLREMFSIFASAKVTCEGECLEALPYRWWLWSFLVLGSCLVLRTESPAHLQSDRTWRWEPAWRFSELWAGLIKLTSLSGHPPDDQDDCRAPVDRTKASLPPAPERVAPLPRDGISPPCIRSYQTRGHNQSILIENFYPFLAQRCRFRYDMTGHVLWYRV